MKRIALFLTLFVAGLALASYASAGPKPPKGQDTTTTAKPHGKSAHGLTCTGKPVKLELKGTIVSVGTDSFVMTVDKANHHAKGLKGSPLTVQVTADTKIRRKGHAQASDLKAGDRVKVHAWACKTSGPDAALTTVVAQKVDAHPAKGSDAGHHPTTTQTTTTTETTTTEVTTTTP
jgi:co-chaperonin GroES (HSP10)